MARMLTLATLAFLVHRADASSLRAPARDHTASSFIGLDHDGKTKMLIQVGTQQSGPACDKIKCADPLVCPPGFTSTEVEGHCCPYCIDTNLKVEPEVTGATGKAGGEASAFCPQVWCFPTLCTKEEVMPTTTNGMCCPTCPV
eukprot:TRINITY_DN28815_c0_g1_i1.p1 TRINITY_DN28815_c0_g1~~TRINITY_DN28815_c0_g1_i1.p1  ORF type:complete len:143 (-),score=29.76 TRINITY_DN28815_c0_g1_i1:16-444(-)